MKSIPTYAVAVFVFSTISLPAFAGEDPEVDERTATAADKTAIQADDRYETLETSLDNRGLTVDLDEATVVTVYFPSEVEYEIALVPTYEGSTQVPGVLMLMDIGEKDQWGVAGVVNAFSDDSAIYSVDCVAPKPVVSPASPVPEVVKKWQDEHTATQCNAALVAWHESEIIDDEMATRLYSLCRSGIYARGDF